MAKFWAYLFVLVAIGQSHPDENAYLNDGRFEAKMMRVQDLTSALASLVKNLQIPPKAGPKFADSLNDMVFSLDKIVALLHQGAISITNTNFHQGAAKVAEVFGKMSYEVQKNLLGDTEKLRESGVKQLEATKVLVTKVIEIFKTSDNKGEDTMTNQMRLANNIGVYSLTKLKLEIELFAKTNKELGPELDAALDDLCVTLKTVKSEDKLTNEELSFLVQQFNFIQNGMIVKLENFVHVYKHIPQAKKVANELSSIFDRFAKILFDNHDAARMLAALEGSLRDSHKWVRHLMECDVGENTAEGLYIRNILFDGIACLRVWEHELKSSVERSH